MSSINPNTTIVGFGSGFGALQDKITKAASFSGDLISITGSFRSLLVELEVFSADRPNANETYDFYITTTDASHSWDLVHFPQIASTGAKKYLAKVDLSETPRSISNAGLTTNDSILLVTTAGADQGIKTLAAGSVRHGVIGGRIGHELVIAGTAPSIVYRIVFRLS